MPLSRERRNPTDVIDLDRMQGRGPHTRQMREQMGLQSAAVDLPEYRRHSVTRDRPELDTGRQKNLRRLAGVGAGMTAAAALFGGNTLAQAGAGLNEGAFQGHQDNFSEYNQAMQVFESELEGVERANTGIENQEIAESRQAALAEARAIAEGRANARQQQIEGQQENIRRRRENIRRQEDNAREDRHRSEDHRKRKEIERLRASLRDSSSSTRSRNDVDYENMDAGARRTRVNAQLRNFMNSAQELARVQAGTDEVASNASTADVQRAQEMQSESIEEIVRLTESLPVAERAPMIANYFTEAKRRAHEMAETPEEAEAIVEQIANLEGRVTSVYEGSNEGLPARRGATAGAQAPGQQQAGQQQAGGQQQQVDPNAQVQLPAHENSGLDPLNTTMERGQLIESEYNAAVQAAEDAGTAEGAIDYLEQLVEAGELTEDEAYWIAADIISRIYNQ